MAEVPLSKAPNPSLLPERRCGCSAVLCCAPLWLQAAHCAGISTDRSRITASPRSSPVQCHGSPYYVKTSPHHLSVQPT
ncbi:hypothetical protein AALO_G00123810 [Alosa alosa]|uniref:Secreted protein n=1 Tax=Alosa alosa TaxID=278164 RepID=A0AAV6GQA8_9TELE|nr:hypothetical protein AALO_G00123810 [Alosa alosa]